MTEHPTSSDLNRTIQDALNRRLPWWQRLADLLRRLPASIGRMGGYWGGVTMWDRRNK